MSQPQASIIGTSFENTFEKDGEQTISILVFQVVVYVYDPSGDRVLAGGNVAAADDLHVGIAVQAILSVILR